MKVMSFNVKHRIFEDITGLWKKRYIKIKEYILKENPDILGLQELSKKGKKYLDKELEDYYIIGKKRHSIIFTNEYNCILIKKKYEIVSHNTFSLSDKINVLGRKHKKDNFPRICVVGHILAGEKKIMIVNTHLDNSDTKNKKRLLKIYEKIVETQSDDEEYIILTGDYNMTLDNKNLNKFASNYLIPFENVTESTFPEYKDIRPIDHIFLDKRLKYKDVKVHTDSNQNGHLSDHYPISCEVEI